MSTLFLPTFYNVVIHYWPVGCFYYIGNLVLKFLMKKFLFSLECIQHYNIFTAYLNYLYKGELNHNKGTYGPVPDFTVVKH